MKQAFTLKEYLLAKMDEEEEVFRIITSLDENEKIEYERLLQELENTHTSEGVSTKEKGESLEKIVRFLLEKSAVFNVHKNIRTSSNEIDQLIILNAKGRKFREQGLLDFKYDVFLSECKNYHGKISVTWVGKFYSLMNYTGTKLGLLFSYHGLTGRGWEDAVGLTKKIYLSKERLEDKIHILEFNKEDFEKIKQGNSLLELISAKIIALRTDTSFEHYISQHPAEEQNN
jgi:hypothetical protein